MRGEFRLLPSGSGPEKWVEFSLPSHWGFAANEGGSSQGKNLYAARRVDCGVLGPRGVGGGCEIVACETRHKILSVCGGICIYLSVSVCECTSFLKNFIFVLF